MWRASTDLFDFDKLFEMMDEDIASPMIGAAEAEARSQGAHGLRPGQTDQAAASMEHAENEPMEVAKEIVVNEMTLSAYSPLKDLRAVAKWPKRLLPPGLTLFLQPCTLTKSLKTIECQVYLVQCEVPTPNQIRTSVGLPH